MTDQQEEFEGRVHPAIYRMGIYYTDLLRSIEAASDTYIGTDPDMKEDVDKLRAKLKKDVESWKSTMWDKHVI